MAFTPNFTKAGLHVSMAINISLFVVINAVSFKYSFLLPDENSKMEKVGIEKPHSPNPVSFSL